MEWTHRIYARGKDTETGKQTRWGALDVSKGNIVGNLIYATVFDLEQGTRTLNRLREENPEVEFELRKI